ncbi:SLC13 family permease [Aliikangiella coralliicola]|uniref:SLC13/DASS family transporter n=1 Tax=Aliikangiella coralliicola TaxID=2592383 RepID=A0A545UAL7_9GAMM|nr:SLC13 family permease [Aliikangiella coralliicola]TQV86512.1 SLC13/DASS family transporter [Aliikangiella coralliicola]
MKKLKSTLLWLTPVISLTLALILHYSGFEPPLIIVASTTLLCAVWWIFEPIPIPVTSLIPLAVFPMTGVLTPSQVAQAYGHHLILLLLGGFILSQSMAYSGAHRRIALIMVNLFGGASPRRLVMGFMAASALLSMWISNTATTLMLLPVALATMENVKDKQLTTVLLLGIAYAASVGGIGTPIGTPPNALFLSTYQETTGQSLGFLSWMKWALPLVIIFIPLMMLWITRNITTKETIEIPQTGKWTTIEKRVMWVFAVTALLWITRQEPFGGWRELTGLIGANDASVAMLACIALFVIPDGKEGRLLDWKAANEIPWGVLLLFAGGICIAKAFGASGLSELIGNQLAGVTALPIILLIAAVAITVTFMTEMTSNTATTALLMPILASAALSAQINPALLMLPAAMSASCAFMLPVATAPNAIVYGSEKVPIQQMVKNGFALNLLGTLLITGVCYLLI